MIKLNWKKTLFIQNELNYQQFIADYASIRPDVSIFDTETSGLHIIKDRPFLVILGFYNSKTEKAATYLLYVENSNEITQKTMKLFWLMSERSRYLAGANIKYDLHMMENIGLPYEGNNMIDIQTLIRLATVALPSERGGAPLGLTQFATQYIDPAAKHYNASLQEARSQIAKDWNKKLSAKFKGRGWTLSNLEKYLKDPINDIDALGVENARLYREWYDSIPIEISYNMNSHIVEKDDIPYNMVPKEILDEYAEFDVIYTGEITFQLLPIVQLRQQMGTLERESKLIRPFYTMERTGFTVDMDYLLEAQVVLKNYIIERRTRFRQLTREDVSVSQSVRLIKVAKERWDYDLSSTKKEVIEDALIDLKRSGKTPEMIEFLELIQELRTLQKWYATYLMSYIRSAKYDGKIYTSIKQSGPVTGRVSSNFQQFPRGAIKDYNGNVLFEPRRFIIKPDDVGLFVWMDYSQIELRFQGLYTILLGVADLNLCRAYMPYQCYTIVEGSRVDFDYDNETHIKNFKKYEWFTAEGSVWTPTDLHAETTAKAFPELDRNSDEFKKMRGSVGKPTNFSKNYGASINAIRRLFKDFSEERIKMIDEAYFKAFPNVKIYQQYCYKIAAQGYMTNLFDRRYYGISGHNGMNALVQGSAADFLKEAIIKIYNYFNDNNLKSKMIMQIHDELVFYIHKDEEYIIPEIRDIMQEYPGTKIPIVAEIEYSLTNWADAVEYEI